MVENHEEQSKSNVVLGRDSEVHTEFCGELRLIKVLSERRPASLEELREHVKALGLSPQRKCVLRQLFGPAFAAIGVFPPNGAILCRGELCWVVASYTGSIRTLNDYYPKNCKNKNDKIQLRIDLLLWSHAKEQELFFY